MVRLRGLALAAGLMAASACTPAAQDQVAREAARSTVARVVAERLPGVPVQPAIDCVIDNANAQQILALAADAVTGVTQSSVEIVLGIVQKPETVSCLAVDGLPVLLSSGLGA